MHYSRIILPALVLYTLTLGGCRDYEKPKAEILRGQKIQEELHEDVIKRAKERAEELEKQEELKPDLPDDIFVPNLKIPSIYFLPKVHNILVRAEFNHNNY